MRQLLNQLATHPLIQPYMQAIQKNDSLVLENLPESAKLLLIALTQQLKKRSILVLTGQSKEEFKLINDASFWSDVSVIDFPSWETLPTENIAPSPDVVGDRFKALHRFSTQPGPYIVLASLQACLQKLPFKSSFASFHFSVQKGQALPFQDLISRLENLGYERTSIARDKGEFAVRGGIIDVFPVCSKEPCRIEFWDEEIESMRSYDPMGQQSIHAIDHIHITAAQEMQILNRSEELSTLLDYLGPDTLLVMDDLESLEDRYASLKSLGGAQNRLFCSIEELMDKVEEHQILYLTKNRIEQLSAIELNKKSNHPFYSNVHSTHALQFEFFQRNLQAVHWNHPFKEILYWMIQEALLPEGSSSEDIMNGLMGLQESSFVALIAQNEAEERSLIDKIHALAAPIPAITQTYRGYLSSGFSLQDGSCIVLPMTEITKRYKIHRHHQRIVSHHVLSSPFDLIPGEAIVHYHHGIGRFLGIEKKPNHHGIEHEYFLLEYAERSKLYVPLSQSHLLSKYVGTKEEIPKVHVLGGNKWKKQREQIETAILGYAADLLKLYAARELKGGYACSVDSKEMHLFEEEFPFVATTDQLKAIQEIKQDMLCNKAMDRLICGDVGYGKTEVAMRAAFKAVVDGKKQVAVLVPTTVLAMQHYENFCDRMANFPIKAEVISRFRSAKAIKAILKEVEQGNIDILIGTHRMINDDIHFKDLGLVIIDEEQRFGVRAKEHLKKIKTGVDCLTLTATPIPRTLYMSLVGARDLSVINTPPQDRLPIKTIIAESEEELVRNALLRELNRDGQAYYIHNRVESIYETASRLQKMLPQARIAVGHGQMSAEEIDEVFHAFKKGAVDILVATSIIENGIDIPNANTILVERSDQFGIADLYQLRGRVGRWNRRAYAYFLVPQRRSLPELAQKRLEAIAQAGGYGGGMKVAMRDLEIRGAGDILGVEQSGHVSHIGFHLYCKLLKRTVESMQGKAPSWTIETKLEITCDARLPEEYVNDVNIRMEFYQRMGDALSWDELEGIWNELQDRFGKAPCPAHWLYHITRLRIWASQRGYLLIHLESLFLSYEKRKGTTITSNKIIFGKYKGPQELVDKIIQTLSSEK